MVIRPHDNNILEKYFESISSLPRLTAEEEKRFAEMWQNDHNQEGLQRLIEGNLRFVVKEAKRFQGLGLDLIDLISEGNLGLIEAAKRFDSGRKTRFLTYASLWIRQAIFRALAENGAKVRLPEKLAAQLYQLGRTIQHLQQRLGHRPSVDEIAGASKFSAKDVQKLLMIQQAINPISTDHTIGNSDILVGDTLEQQIDPSASETFEREAHLNKLKFGLAMLNERERRIIELHYGIDGNQPMGLENIGKTFSPPLSREYVRQLEKRAFDKIRKNDSGLASHFLSRGRK